jgi:hypothetical protein
MKKATAILMCMVMMLVMIPSFFASAAALPEETAVVAADDAGTGQVDNSLADPLTAMKGFIELWGGILKTILGSDVWNNFLPALKQVLSLVSIKDFFSTIGAIWKDVRS